MRLPLFKLFFARHGCIWIACICCSLLVVSSGFAATQGKWGRTSTATAKITLIIPPKTSADSPASLHHQNGADALARFCQQGSAGGYQFSLLGKTDQPLSSVLTSHCLGKPLESELSQQSGTTTLLVAPL